MALENILLSGFPKKLYQFILQLEICKCMSFSHSFSSVLGYCNYIFTFFLSEFDYEKFFFSAVFHTLLK